MSASSDNAVKNGVAAQPWTWSPEVLEFARANGVAQYLDPLLDATRRIFSHARWLKVYLSYDPEYPDWQTILFDVGVEPMPKDVRRQLDRQWGKEWQRIYEYPREPIFGLLLRSGEQWTGPLFSK